MNVRRLSSSAFVCCQPELILFQPRTAAESCTRPIIFISQYHPPVCQPPIGCRIVIPSLIGGNLFTLQYVEPNSVSVCIVWYDGCQLRGSTGPSHVQFNKIVKSLRGKEFNSVHSPGLGMAGRLLIQTLRCHQVREHHPRVRPLVSLLIRNVTWLYWSISV